MSNPKLQQVKDEVAREHGFADWQILCHSKHEAFCDIEYYYDLATELYHAASKWVTDDYCIEEVYSTYEKEIDSCFDVGLQSDGEVSWICAELILEKLAEAGFALVKIELPNKM